MVDDPNKAEEFKKLADALEGKAQAYAREADDVEGYWAPELSPIHCIPRNARLFDGTIDKQRVGMLILVELVSPCAVYPPGKDEEEPRVAQPGAIVGVWGQPGLKGIRNLCGVKTYIKLTGEKDTGKPNPMKVFEIRREREGTLIPIKEDLRQMSRSLRTFLDPSPVTVIARTTQQEAPPSDKDLDEIPF